MLERALPSLTAEDVARLEARCETVTFDNGATIIDEGEVATDLRMIRSGTVRVTRRLLDDLTAEFTGPLGPGDLLGEMSFIDNTGASACIRADGAVDVVVIPHAIIEDLIAEDPSFAGRFYHSILIVMCRRLRRTNMRVLPTSDV